MKKNYTIITKESKVGIKLTIFIILNDVLLLNHENIKKNNSYIHYQLRSGILIWINFEFRRITIDKLME